MALNGKHLLIGSAIIGVAYLICKKKGVNGIGTTKNPVDRGAEYIYNAIMNNDKLYNWCFEIIRHHENFISCVKGLECWIQREITQDILYKDGMYLGREARIKAAKDLTALYFNNRKQFLEHAIIVR